MRSLPNDVIEEIERNLRVALPGGNNADAAVLVDTAGSLDETAAVSHGFTRRLLCDSAAQSQRCSHRTALRARMT